jgi:hypothetical protein
LIADASRLKSHGSHDLEIGVSLSAVMEDSCTETLHLPLDTEGTRRNASRACARRVIYTLTDVKDERAHPIVGLATPESPIRFASRTRVHKEGQVNSLKSSNRAMNGGASIELF